MRPTYKTIKHNVMSLIQHSTNLNHLLQIHALILKTALDINVVVLTKLLGKILTPIADDISYARNLFDTIPQPDTFMFNTMIRGYLKSNNPEESLSLFMRMCRFDGICIDSFSLSVVLQSCGRLVDSENGESLHAYCLKHGFGSDLFVQTALIEMYGRFGLVDVSRKVFDEIKDPDCISCNVMLGEYVRVREMGLAEEFFDKISDRDLVSWNTMIHGYASIGDIESAQDLFDTSARKDFVSWSSMFPTCAKSRCSSNALKLFHEMQLSNVVPDQITMVSVLCACGDIGALGMGKMIHEYIKRSCIEIGIRLGTSLVDMYAKCGDIDNAVGCFKQMSKKDVFAWSAMIMGLANHGYGEAALDLFSKMISEGTKPNDITFIGVLTACSHIGLFDKGWTYFNAMSDIYCIPPKIEHYGNMVDILGRSGRLQEARELIRSMPFEPDAVILRALLGACKIYRNVELAEEAIIKLVALEPNVDRNYVLLSNIYSQAKQWDKVVNVRRIMKNNKIQRIPGSSSIEIGNEVHEFISGDESHLQSVEIYKMLSEIMNRLKEAGYVPLTTSVLQDINDKEKETLLVRHSEKLAIAFGILNTAPGVSIRIVKNLRVCDDCHSAIKIISIVYNRKIIIRDRNRFHHFVAGTCSCYSDSYTQWELLALDGWVGKNITTMPGKRELFLRSMSNIT
ncbi:pentatricopeptide repeat-containing protein At1g74630-like isoform X2 [Daucus carota subsp. sativus]|uniref:pentatricopeptide repeat-containing protein At1g74630-like isoform X2 n=1 Tax=Daucus carota subsp. sativus TaxID=79200 RepID=UPI00308312CB